MKGSTQNTLLKTTVILPVCCPPLPTPFHPPPPPGPTVPSADGFPLAAGAGVQLRRGHRLQVHGPHLHRPRPLPAGSPPGTERSLRPVLFFPPSGGLPLAFHARNSSFPRFSFSYKIMHWVYPILSPPPWTHCGVLRSECVNGRGGRVTDQEPPPSDHPGPLAPGRGGASTSSIG